MRYPRLAAKLYGAPLLVTEERYAMLEHVFRAYNTGNQDKLPPPEDFHRPEMSAGMTRTKAGYGLTEEGIAVVPVVGTLVQRADMMDAASGLLGYNNVGAQISAAVGDDAVKGILLEIDSPGGEANGCFELAKRVAAWGQQKPIWAIANEQAFSAAYALASSATKLYVPQTGMVGSVGVLMMHVDQSKLDAQVGLTFTPIYAGKKKVDFSSHAPLSERAQEDAQMAVDRLYDIFVSTVATGRGINEATVRGTQAGLLNPEEALAIGFVDGIASFAETLSALTAFTQSTNGMRAAVSARALTGGLMPEANTPAAAQPAAIEVNAEQIRAEARAAERTRIAGITGCAEAEGRGSLAQHIAHNTEMSMEDAQKMLAAAPREAAVAAAPVNRLDAAMEGVGNPNVGPDLVPGQATAESNDAPPEMIARVVSLHNASRGRK